jgi:hypothetical protein
MLPTPPQCSTTVALHHHHLVTSRYLHRHALPPPPSRCVRGRCDQWPLRVSRFPKRRSSTGEKKYSSGGAVFCPPRWACAAGWVPGSDREIGWVVALRNDDAPVQAVYISACYCVIWGRRKFKFLWRERDVYWPFHKASVPGCPCSLASRVHLCPPVFRLLLPTGMAGSMSWMDGLSVTSSCATREKKRNKTISSCRSQLATTTCQSRIFFARCSAGWLPLEAPLIQSNLQLRRKH